MDEFNIKSQGELDKDILNISWSLTDYCNYQCSYCCAKSMHIEKNINFLEFNVYKKTIDKIFQLNKEKYNFFLAGGEPTIHPHILDIVKYLNESKKNIYLEITSNGAMNISIYDDLFKNTDNIDYTLTISIHLEYIKNTKKIENILRIAKEKNKNVAIAFMMHPTYIENRDIILNQLLELKKIYNFNIYFEEIYESPNFTNLDNRYTKKYIEWIEENRKKQLHEINSITNLHDFKSKYYMEDGNINIINNYESVYLNKKRFYGFFCCLGTRVISIWSNGLCSGAECSIGKRQNIYNDEFNWFEFYQYVKCTNDYCRCKVNNELPKFKEEKDAKLFQQKYFLENINFLLGNIIYTDIFNLNKNLIELKNNTEDRIDKLIDIIAWWIPIKKWRDNFRAKFRRPDQTRPDQTRPDQTRPDQTRPDLIYI